MNPNQKCESDCKFCDSVMHHKLPNWEQHECICHTKEEKKCTGAHCKCMNLDGECPNMHHADCVEHNPYLKSPTKPSIEGEWLRSEWSQFYTNIGMQPIHLGMIAKNTIADWWLEKLSTHTQNVLESLKVEVKSLTENAGHDESWYATISNVLSLIESYKNKYK